MMHTYGRVGRFVNRQVWAIEEATLDTIVEVLRKRSAGVKLERDEIRAIIGTGEPPKAQRRETIAVLPIYGVIAPKMNMFMEISGGTSLEQFLRDFRAVRDDASVTAIVADIDSPGGSAYMLPEAFAEIYAARGVKPLVAMVRPMCGSAALFLASAFSEIVCTPSGEIGSLGCYMVHEDWSKANEMMGVKPTYIHYGQYKVEGNPDEPLGDEAAAYLQAMVNAFGQDFEKHVAKGRGVSLAHVREHFGQGRMLLAKDAKAVGLIDRIATIEETLARLAKAGGRGRPTVALHDAGAIAAAAADEAPIESAVSLDGEAVAEAVAAQVPTSAPQASASAEPDAETTEAMDPAAPDETAAPYPAAREALLRELEIRDRV